MSFLNNLFNSVTDKIRQVAVMRQQPYDVTEVTTQQFAKLPIVAKEESLTLFKDNNIFIAVVFVPGTSQAFSMFRLNSEPEAVKQFNNFGYKLHGLFCAAGTKLMTRDQLQKISDLLREHPGWNCAHLAAKLSLADCFKNEFVNSCLSVADEETGKMPLHIAIDIGDTKCIQEMLFCGARLDAVDNKGCNVFHYAARMPSEAIIQLLAAKDRSMINKLNASGEGALHEACLNDQPQNAEFLLRWGIDPNTSESHRYPIHCAVRVSSVKCISILCKWSRNQVHLLDKKYNSAPLHWARDRECIYKLVEFGANVDALNKNNETALHIMVRQNRYDCVMGLLAKGADASLLGQNGDNALHMAIESDDPDTVQLLIVFGANVNGCNSLNVTPRHKAATSTGKNRDIIIHLLHCVGASRCPIGMAGCGPGCEANGSMNGTPKLVPATKSPDQQKKFHTGPMAQFAMQAAMSRSASICGTSGAFDGSDSMSIGGSAGDRLLCLDGGGIRGLVLIQLLQAIENATRQPIRNCFDWIGGTSTGGILALALVHGKSVRYCLGLYFQLKDAVFCGKRPYSSEPLEAFLKQEFGETTRMSENSYPRVLVTGVLADRMPAELHLFRNYDVPGAGDHTQQNSQFQPLPRPNDQHVWKAARSSGAAPTYFRAYGRFLDGGLMSNNPTLDVLTEVHQYNLALKAKGDPSLVRPIHVVVSLGTGRLPLKAVDACDVYRPEGVFDLAKVVFGAKNLAELLVDQATQSEGRAVERAAAWCSMIDVPYFRFSPQLSEDIPLDCKDDKVLVNMLWETQCYIVEHKSRIDQLASLLWS